MQARTERLVDRYKRNYDIAEGVDVDENVVLAHWELEKQLAKMLLESKPEERWDLFESSYTCLYEACGWLNQTEQNQANPENEEFETWRKTIGEPPQRIYEIGSGQGFLIRYLAAQGFVCTGTEITKERGQKHVTEFSGKLSWSHSDGVHLDRFEQPGTYDIAISRQVMEHFHPADIVTHLKSCYAILSDRGRYIFTTPHCHTGPHDISRVFQCDEPLGMHLKEYTYSELLQAAKAAGFRKIYCSVPAKFWKLFALVGMTRPEQMIGFGSFYLGFMIGLERLLFLVPVKKLRTWLSLTLRKLLVFRDNIFLVLQK